MNWLKYVIGFSAILVAGCAAYFSVTGLGVLFSGASLSVMVMAGSLEIAKLGVATYLKQVWNNTKGFIKWYLTTAVVILMLITSAGIFGFLSNAFQQQNLKIQKIERDISVYQTQITKNEKEINRYTLQLTNQQNIRNSQENNLTKQIDKNISTSRVSTMIKNADNEIKNISLRIDSLTKENNISLDSINSIKNRNIDIEKEVGGFRFVAEAFNVELKSVVKFFILLIVFVFDPLAIALVIAFNQLIMSGKKKNDDEPMINDELDDFEGKRKENMDSGELKNLLDETTRLRLSNEELNELEKRLLKKQEDLEPTIEPSVIEEEKKNKRDIFTNNGYAGTGV